MIYGALGQYALGQINTPVSYSVDAEAGAYSISGQDVTLTLFVPNTYVLSAIGELALGQFASIPAAGAFSVSAGVGSYDITGQDVTFLRTYVVPFDAGEYILTGQDAGLKKGFNVVSDVGTYSLSGQDVELRSGLPEGVYTLTGQDVTLRWGHVTIADVGTYTLSGQAAGLAVSMPADVGTYTLTGQDASITATRYLYPTPYLTSDTYVNVLFAALGQAPLGGSQFIDASTSSVTTYELTGFDTILRKGFSVQVDVGNYTLTGQDATPTATRFLYPDTGVYTLTGQVAQLPVTMPAEAGTYTLTGQPAEFGRRRRRMRGFPRVGSGINGTSRVGTPITARAA